MDKTLLWLWLTAKNGISEQTIYHLWERYGDIEKIYTSEKYDDAGWLDENDKNRLLNKDLSRAREISIKTQKMGARIITYDDETYPMLLKNMDDPPFVLYIKGEEINFDRVLGIGVVGTRRFSEYGHRVTHDICYDLALAGALIVSGLARGIDSIAASTALSVGAKTVGVLGCGLDVIYPPENGELYERTAQNGMLITEYPPGTKAIGSNFPRRNRIIAGLSRGVVVTEAPQRSGALITARLAMENGRDVFSVPRSITHPYSGTNRLIQQGAKLITCGGDVLEDYPYLENTLVPIKTPKYKKEDVYSEHTLKPKGKIENKNTDNAYKERFNEIYNKCDDNQKKIVKLIGTGEMHIDELVRESGMETSKVSTELMMMEMSGFIKKQPGNKYSIKL
ncbi:MAG: DNA-processing protein DprA [Clostridiales bacterium]|nr:DNA-processing protein DprA [Clostridiales bacterium]